MEPTKIATNPLLLREQVSLASFPLKVFKLKLSRIIPIIITIAIIRETSISPIILVNLLPNTLTCYSTTTEHGYCLSKTIALTFPTLLLPRSRSPPT